MATNKILESTVELMLSDDYRDRFRAEYKQLVNRRNKLKKMVKGYNDGSLDFEPDCPIDLLEDQLSVMNAYVEILKKRAKIEGISLK